MSSSSSSSLRMWWRIAVVVGSLILFMAVIGIVATTQLKGSSMEDYRAHVLDFKEKQTEAADFRQRLFASVGGFEEDDSPTIELALNKASHITATEAFASERGYDVPVPGTVAFNRASCEAASFDSAPPLPAQFETIADVKAAAIRHVEFFGEPNLELAALLLQNFRHHMEWITTDEGDSFCVNTLNLKDNFCGRQGGGLDYDPGAVSCDENGVCRYTRIPTCVLSRTYCQSKGVSHDGAGFGDCYTNDFQGLAEAVLGPTVTRVYRKRGEALVRGCQESVLDCGLAVGRLLGTGSEILNASAKQAAINFGNEFSENCGGGIDSASDWIACNQTIAKLNPDYWIEVFLVDAFIGPITGFVGVLPELSREFWFSVSDMDPSGALDAVNLVAEWFDKGTDVSPIIADYGLDGVDAIQKGGDAAIKFINVFGASGAFTFAKLGASAAALADLGLQALELAVTGYLAAPLLMTALTSALFENIPFVGDLIPQELLNLDRYALEAVNAVFDYVEGPIGSAIGDFVTTGIDAIGDSFESFSCLFRDCSPPPLYVDWKFSLPGVGAVVPAPTTDALFPFKIVTLGQLLSERRADCIWPSTARERFLNLDLEVDKSVFGATLTAHAVTSFDPAQNADYWEARAKNHFSCFRVLSQRNDEYVTTGDCLLPLQPHQWDHPVLGALDRIRVLMVRNDPLYSRVFAQDDSTQPYEWLMDDNGSGDARDLSVFGAPKKLVPGFTFLGDIFESSSQDPLSKGRVVAAVNDRYLKPIGVSGQPTNDQRMIGNGRGLGFKSSWSFSARTTPYHTFVTCANGLGSYCETTVEDDGSGGGGLINVPNGNFQHYDIVPEAELSTGGRRFADSLMNEFTNE